MPGTKDDLITALILEPHNEECVSLIARAFPGKNADELLSTQEAIQCKQRLDRTIHTLASRMQYATSPSHLSTSTVTKLFNELDLKFEEPSDLHSVKESSTVLTKSSKDDVESLVSEEIDTMIIGGEGDSMAPRDWSVLSHPLPELTSDPQGVIPVLRDCLQEHLFHKKIYYSKKNVSCESY